MKTLACIFLCALCASARVNAQTNTPITGLMGFTLSRPVPGGSEQYRITNDCYMIVAPADSPFDIVTVHTLNDGRVWSIDCDARNATDAARLGDALKLKYGQPKEKTSESQYTREIWHDCTYGIGPNVIETTETHSDVHTFSVRYVATDLKPIAESEEAKRKQQSTQETASKL